MEGERSVPVKAKAFAGLFTSASGHCSVGDVYDLVCVIDVCDWVATCMCSECELVLVAGYVFLETWIAAAGACAEWVSEREFSACSGAYLGCD